MFWQRRLFPYSKIGKRASPHMSASIVDNGCLDCFVEKHLEAGWQEWHDELAMISPSKRGSRVAWVPHLCCLLIALLPTDLLKWHSQLLTEIKHPDKTDSSSWQFWRQDCLQWGQVAPRAEPHPRIWVSLQRWGHPSRKDRQWALGYGLQAGERWKLASSLEVGKVLLGQSSFLLFPVNSLRSLRAKDLLQIFFPRCCRSPPSTSTLPSNSTFIHLVLTIL